MSKNTRNRILLTALAALLLVTLTIGGTMAWLVDDTQTITNTFTTSEIDVDLIEHDYDPTTNQLSTTETTQANSDYKFIPGMNLPKDPKLSAYSDIAYYVYVKVNIANWPTTSNISYTLAIAADWDQFTYNGETIYYKACTAGEKIENMSLLTGDQITVSSNLNKSELDAISTNPTMTFTAYACQQYGFSASGDKSAAQVAWETNFAAN